MKTGKYILGVATGFFLLSGRVVHADTPVVTNAPAIDRAVSSGDFSIRTTDGKCTITINSTRAPGLTEWAEQKLAPVLAEWYPKIVAMLPSDGYTAPAHFSIILKPMDGVAYTTGNKVTANSTWLETEMGGEAIGSLVHETVHVVQQFGNHGRQNPGWLVEGIRRLHPLVQSMNRKATARMLSGCEHFARRHCITTTATASRPIF